MRAVPAGGPVLVELLDRAAAALAAADALPPIAEEIAAYDREHGTAYAASLRAYLEHGENVAAAASELRLHANSLRYRLRRVSELFDLDLGTADARLAAWMSLRLVPPGERRIVQN